MYDSVENPVFEEIIDLLELSNEEMREDETIVDMSKELFIEEPDTVSERRALEIFYEGLADHTVVAIDDGRVVGMLCMKENDPFFKNGASEYFPHLAGTYATTHPEYRESGVFKSLGEKVENSVVPKYDVDYIVGSVSEHNEASRSSCESMGLERVSTLDYDDEVTYVYAKPV